MSIDIFYSLFANTQRNNSTDGPFTIVLCAQAALTCGYLLRLSFVANMTIPIRLKMACSLLTANWIFIHIEFSSIQ
jgi:hypothetical protein